MQIKVTTTKRLKIQADALWFLVAKIEDKNGKNLSLQQPKKTILPCGDGYAVTEATKQRKATLRFTTIKYGVVKTLPP